MRNKMWTDWKRFGRRKMKKYNEEVFFETRIILHDSTILIIYHYSEAKGHRITHSEWTSCKLWPWVLRLNQYRLSDSSTCLTVVQDNETWHVWERWYRNGFLMFHSIFLWTVYLSPKRKWNKAYSHKIHIPAKYKW